MMIAASHLRVGDRLRLPAFAADSAEVHTAEPRDTHPDLNTYVEFGGPVPVDLVPENAPEEEEIGPDDLAVRVWPNNLLIDIDHRGEPSWL